MRFFFAPIARRWVADAGGGRSKDEKKNGAQREVGEREMRVRNKAAVRFAEQGWSFLYYIIYWSFGMVSTTCISSQSSDSSKRARFWKGKEGRKGRASELPFVLSFSLFRM